MNTLREKCLYSELFWSVFSRIRTEYGETLFYAVMMVTKSRFHFYAFGFAYIQADLTKRKFLGTWNSQK